MRWTQNICNSGQSECHDDEIKQWYNFDNDLLKQVSGNQKILFSSLLFINYIKKFY